MTNYKVIRQRGSTKLIQTPDGQRYLMPSYTDDIDLAVLVDLWDILVDPALAQKLRQHNIYTYQDLKEHPEIASLTMQHGQDYYALLAATKKEIEQ